MATNSEDLECQPTPFYCPPILSPSLPISGEDLAQILPSEVIEVSHPSVNPATGDVYQIRQYFVRDDVGVAEEYQCSPLYIRRIHKQSDPVTPDWVDASDLMYRVQPLEKAVRMIAHFARKPVNALNANKMMAWAVILSPSQHALIDPSGPSSAIWPLSTPLQHAPSIQPLRQRARRTAQLGGYF
ncbi:hypothetical protein H0H93_007421 [Arthromyces matolae]|nr:hypothetical protein H0H93_007421 [Arthromyces matolae]